MRSGFRTEPSMSTTDTTIIAPCVVRENTEVTLVESSELLKVRSKGLAVTSCCDQLAALSLPLMNTWTYSRELMPWLKAIAGLILNVPSDNSTHCSFSGEKRKNPSASATPASASTAWENSDNHCSEIRQEIRDRPSNIYSTVLLLVPPPNPLG